jgi:hypothetical protein
VQHPQAGAFESPWLHACRVSAPSPDRSCCRPTTPKFRRNRERVARDAERERLILEWDLGYEEPETA